MAYCNHCGSEHDRKGKYCSNSCKTKAYNQRKMQNQSMVGPGANMLPTIQHKIGEGLGDSAKNLIAKATPKYPNSTVNHVNLQAQRRRTIYYLSCSFGGGVLGLLAVKYFFQSDSPNIQNYVIGATAGAGVGAYGGYMGELMFDPFEIWQTPEEKAQKALSDGSENEKAMTAREYANLPTYTLNWAGKWGNYLGRVGQNDIIMVWGNQGSGKSHLVSQLASELGIEYDVLYITAEEGIAPHVQERFKNYNFPSRNIKILPTRDAFRARQEIDNHNYQFVIIDSLQGLKLTYDNQVSFIQSVAKAVHGLIFINQANKNGDFKGLQALAHEVHTEIYVEDGVAQTIKNRQREDKPTENVFAENIENKLKKMGTDHF